jgi:hypothetical protein
MKELKTEILAKIFMGVHWDTTIDLIENDEVLPSEFKTKIRQLMPKMADSQKIQIAREIGIDNIIEALGISNRELETIVRTRMAVKHNQVKKILQARWKDRSTGTELVLDIAFFEHFFSYKKSAKGMMPIIDALPEPKLDSIIELFEGGDFVVIEETQLHLAL